MASSGVAWSPGLLAGDSLGDEAMEKGLNRFNLCKKKRILKTQSKRVDRPIVKENQQQKKRKKPAVLNLDSTTIGGDQ